MSPFPKNVSPETETKKFSVYLSMLVKADHILFLETASLLLKKSACAPIPGMAERERERERERG